VAGDD
jgi:MFS family permease